MPRNFKTIFCKNSKASDIPKVIVLKLNLPKGVIKVVKAGDFSKLELPIFGIYIVFINTLFHQAVQECIPLLVEDKLVQFVPVYTYSQFSVGLLHTHLFGAFQGATNFKFYLGFTKKWKSHSLRLYQ